MAILDELVRDATALCEIPAPTGSEEARGRRLARMFREAGLAVSTDGIGNVVAEAEGDPDLPCVALAAHLDTVFPDIAEIEVREAGGWLHAPGIGDNSMGTAALAVLARRLPDPPRGRILLVGTVGEEGNGDLRGVRHLVETRGGEIDVLVAVEGGMRDQLVTRGVGAERVRVTVTGPGGHSWGDAGNPSAVEGAAAAVGALYGLELPDAPRTSLNVGTIGGGHSVNSIAGRAVFELDLRSVDQATLTGLRARALRAVEDALGEGLAATGEPIGSRPAGALDPGHPLPGLVQAAREEAGLDPAEETASSTDANVALAAGLPAVCVGIGVSQGAHRPVERVRIEGLDRGFEALRGPVRRLARPD